MNDDFRQTSAPSNPFVYDPDTRPELFDAVLSRRIVAFIVDAILIVVLLIPAALLVFIAGLVTFGLGWFLYGPLFALVALAYVAVTLGGRNSATVGMRFAGIEMRTWSGGPMFPLLAIMHAILFWFSIGVLTPLILLVGLVTYRRQLLHDLLLGVVVVNSEPLQRMPSFSP
jgi:uncharacterized RDD family membrane protein YckC